MVRCSSTKRVKRRGGGGGMYTISRPNEAARLAGVGGVPGAQCLGLPSLMSLKARGRKIEHTLMKSTSGGHFEPCVRRKSRQNLYRGEKKGKAQVTRYVYDLGLSRKGH